MSKSENYEEFFYGKNKQEIENEKRKRKVLMSLFPKRMGDIDYTKYVLRNDNKTIDIYNTIELEQNNKPKNDDTRKKSIDFEKNKNSFNFGNKEKNTQEVNNLNNIENPYFKTNNYFFRNKGINTDLIKNENKIDTLKSSTINYNDSLWNKKMNSKQKKKHIMKKQKEKPNKHHI